MGPGYYIIAILGCADGSTADCTPMATINQRYESEAACAAAAPEVLMANTDLDSPNLVAECRAETRVEAESKPLSKTVPGPVRRG